VKVTLIFDDGTKHEYDPDRIEVQTVAPVKITTEQYALVIEGQPEPEPYDLSRRDF